MADTNSNANPSNQINLLGKIVAGLLLTCLTTMAIYLVIAFWPDKMPPVSAGDDGAWYNMRRFNVTLIDGTDSAGAQKNKALQLQVDSLKKSIAAQKDTTQKNTDSVAPQKPGQPAKALNEEQVGKDSGKRIHLNTILLLLVALMGFLGNMVHVATSFTTYVGMGTFERNWILWYFVKPFTAAGLAIIMYFIIRAGFLNYGSGASSVSLYGILALSALAGLFTDSATLKLKEVFEVIFKPKDDRTGKLQGDGFAVASILPDPIPAGKEATLTVTGNNLNTAGLKITLDGSPVIPASNTGDKLEIKYNAPASGKASLVFKDSAGKTLLAKDIDIK